MFFENKVEVSNNSNNKSDKPILCINIIVLDFNYSFDMFT